jgi:LEA14-like dessication related protein
MNKGLTAVAIIGGISLFGYGLYKYFTRQIDLLKQFNWKVLDFSLDTLDLKVIKGTIKFRFSSISDVELEINKFYLDVYANGERVGYIEDVNTFIIPAKGYTDIPFAYTINPQFIIKNIVDIIAYTTKQEDAIITFDGYIKIKSGFISATVPIKSDCSVKNLECVMG